MPHGGYRKPPVRLVVMTLFVLGDFLMVFCFQKVAIFNGNLLFFRQKSVAIWSKIIKKEGVIGRNAQNLYKQESDARCGIFLIVAPQHLVSSIKKIGLAYRFLLSFLHECLNFWQICELTKTQENCNILYYIYNKMEKCAYPRGIFTAFTKRKEMSLCV